MSPLRTALTEYLDIRRALGFKLQTAGITLRQFVHFAEWEGAICITTDLALRWATQPQGVQPAHWATRLGMVRGFAQYCRALDSRTEVPPHGLLPYRYRRQPPYIYSEQEIAHLLTAARQLHSPTGLRPYTYATLLGLLTVTGMRLSEVLHLERNDVELTQGSLTIRQSKFGKTRWIPLHPSTQDALQQYARFRDQLWPRPPTLRFFLSEQGTPLTVWSVQQTFVRLSRQIGLRGATDRSGPRLHDLRHRFAVRTLLHWYRTGVDVEHLEQARGNRASSRNARLAALHSFFHYAALYAPQYSAVIHRVLAIPSKRTEQTDIAFLTRPEIEALLEAPSQATWTGRRDRTLLLIAVQTGLRVSELTGLQCQDVVLGAGAHVHCSGKGRKERCTPLRQDAAAALRLWLRERQGGPLDPVFPNARGGTLSRDGVAYLLAKHVATARQHCNSLQHKRISPHVLRHTVAMELLLHGVDRAVIALWLGHESVETTQRYFHASLELKEQALAKTTPLHVPLGRYRPDDQLLAFLKGL